MISIAAASGAISAGAFVAAYLWYRSFPETKIRSKLSALFRDGDLCLKKKGRKREIKLYPRVIRVTATINHIQATIHIPPGMDPKRLHDSIWLFKQAFGPHIELSEDCSVFTLIIYYKDMSQFDYDPRAVLPTVKGMRLPIVAGRSRKGWETYDMAKHPHLLISGETGSGKSVALRAILTTLVETCGDRIDLYCADLKRSEFHLFRGIAKEVIVETDNLRRLLRKLQKEMQRRGDLLDAAEESHVDDLPNPPPYIVLAIDEVSLLRKEKDIMAAVEDISSIGRALGVFLILSLQRPDAKMLDGALKNNLTVRMAFRQSDEINSRIAIGSGEAADIRMSQKGRMYMKGEELKQIQMPYLELAEAKKLLSPHKDLQPVKGPTHDYVEGEFTVVDDDVFGVL